MFKTHTEKLAHFLFVKNLRSVKTTAVRHGTRCNTAEARMHAAGYDIWTSALHLRLYCIRLCLLLLVLIFNFVY
jgi:hypothetical protein